MVIEHTFVTTLESADALRAAGQFLADRGFTARAEDAFPTGGGWQSVELTRGVANPARAKGVADLPQRVRIEWDRGRVVVAASVTPKVAKHANVTARPAEAAAVDLAAVKPGDALACLLFTTVRVLEMLLADRDPEAAAEAWARLDDGLARRAAAAERRLRRHRVILYSILGGIALLIAALVAWSVGQDR